MTNLTHALGLVLLHSIWQGALVALALWMALKMLRRRPAHARYLAGCAAMALLVVLPALTMGRAYPNRVFFVIPTNSPLVWLANFEAWAPVVWAVGVVMFSLRMLWACWRVSLLKRRGLAAEESVVDLVSRLAKQMGITRRVRVINSFLADGPSVAGWIRPVILLPAATVLGLTPEQLEAVLAHELAHVRRYDYLVNLVQMTIETLWFYHPAVWWISGRIRREREWCCDDIAVTCCGDALCYARALAALERMRTEQQLMPELALGARDGGLLIRIQRLLGVAPRDTHVSHVPAFAALAMAVACFALNTSPVRAQTPVPQPEQSQTIPVPPRPAPQTAPTRVPAESDSWIRFSTADTTPLSSRSISYRLGWELAYLNISQGIDLEDVAWLVPVKEGMRRDASPEAARELESIVEKMAAAREAAQSDEARRIPTWKLTVVTVTGLSDARRNELLSKLPLHESYPVSHERMDAAGLAIREFDPTLRYSFLTAWDGHAEMRIAARTEN